MVTNAAAAREMRERVRGSVAGLPVKREMALGMLMERMSARPAMRAVDWPGVVGAMDDGSRSRASVISDS